MLFIVPLAFLRKLDSMKYTSLLALTAVVYLVIILCYAYLHPFANATPAGQWVVGKLTLNGFASLPVFIFAFTCHQNVSNFTQSDLRPINSYVDTDLFSV